MRLLQRMHIGRGALHAIELACEIERFRAGPGELHQLEIFGGAAIALDLRAEVAVALLLLVGLAGDDVDCEPAVGEMIEGRDLARHQGGRDEARPVRDQIAELARVVGGVQRDKESFGRGGGVADERQVEAGLVMGAGELHEVARREPAFQHVQGRLAGGRRDADHSNDPDGHRRSSL